MPYLANGALHWSYFQMTLPLNPDDFSSLAVHLLFLEQRNIKHSQFLARQRSYSTANTVFPRHFDCCLTEKHYNDSIFINEDIWPIFKMPTQSSLRNAKY